MTDQLSTRVRKLETDEPPVVYNYSDDNVSAPPTQGELDTAFGGTAAQWRDGYSAIVDDNGAATDVWLCVSKNDLWHTARLSPTGSLGSGTPPELAYWATTTTLGSATDVEFLATGGLNFVGGGAAPSNAEIRVLDNVQDALHVSDAGGVEYIRVTSSNTQPELVINEGSTDLDFRIESDVDTHTFFMQGSSGNMSMGTSAIGGRLNIDGNLRISGATDRALFFTPGNIGVTQMSLRAITGGHIDFRNQTSYIHRFDQSGVVYIGRQPGATGRIDITNEHAGGEPAIDTLFQLDRYTTGTATSGSGVRWRNRSEDAGGTLREVTNVEMTWTNAATAQRSGKYTVNVVSNASIVEMMALNGLNTQPSAIFNDGGIDIDFRVESTMNTHALFVDAETSWVGVSGCTLPDQAFEVEELELLNGNVNDGYSAAVRLDPGYEDDNNGYTVTRHNYIEYQNVGLLDTAAVTDAFVMNFDAIPANHYALDVATTKTTPSSVDVWVKINITGTTYYMPGYLSKTT